MATREADEIAFGDELHRIGWRGEADPADLRGLGAYFKLRIEPRALVDIAKPSIAAVDQALAQI